MKGNSATLIVSVVRFIPVDVVQLKVNAAQRPNSSWAEQSDCEKIIA